MPYSNLIDELDPYHSFIHPAINILALLLTSKSESTKTVHFHGFRSEKGVNLSRLLTIPAPGGHPQDDNTSEDYEGLQGSLFSVASRPV